MGTWRLRWELNKLCPYKNMLCVQRCTVRCWQVQCREPKTGQQKVQLYYEDYTLCPSSYFIYLWLTYSLYIFIRKYTWVEVGWTWWPPGRFQLGLIIVSLSSLVLHVATQPTLTLSDPVGYKMVTLYNHITNRVVTGPPCCQTPPHPHSLQPCRL